MRHKLVLKRDAVRQRWFYSTYLEAAQRPGIWYSCNEGSKRRFEEMESFLLDRKLANFTHMSLYLTLNQLRCWEASLSRVKWSSGSDIAVDINVIYEVTSSSSTLSLNSITLGTTNSRRSLHARRSQVCFMGWIKVLPASSLTTLFERKGLSFSLRHRSVSPIWPSQ